MYMSSPRLIKELKDITRNPPLNCSAGLTSENNIKYWTATIHGPTDSPYAGGIFQLSIKFKNDYPFVAPDIRFKTKIYHPNINSSGEICLDILKSNWVPTFTVSSTLLSICSLLDDPNPDDPLDGDAARLYKEDREAYNKKVKQYVMEFASSEK